VCKPSSAPRRGKMIHAHLPLHLSFFGSQTAQAWHNSTPLLSLCRQARRGYCGLGCDLACVLAACTQFVISTGYLSAPSVAQFLSNFCHRPKGGAPMTEMGPSPGGPMGLAGDGLGIDCDAANGSRNMAPLDCVTGA
jgi:hypothetical protein